MASLENWTLIFTTNNGLEAKLAEDVLKQHGIESHIASNADSALPSIGESKLYTLKEDAEKAVEILREADIKKGA